MKALIKLKDYNEMTFILDEANAPLSVKNFIEIANSGYYTGLIFHRIIPNFMIQGGGMTADMRSAPSLKPIKGEFKSNGVNNNLKHTPGVLSMARTNEKNSATSQFFICVANTPHLNGEYAAFASPADQATIDTAISISKVPTTSKYPYRDVPVKPLVIEYVKIQ